MAQVKVLTAKPNDLSLFHENYIVEEQSDSWKLLSDVHICAVE